jgi:ABC-type cobalamin/Fe3+-siderophores transport system ATPase subunit
METNEDKSFESLTCIKELNLAARNKKLNIRLAYPETPQDNFCINLLCGPNGSGKTYVLNSIFDGITEKDIHLDSHGLILSKDVEIGLSQDKIQSLPKVLYVGKTWQFKDHIGATKLNAKLKDETKDRISYSFMYEQLTQHLKDQICSIEEWLESEKRSNYVKDLKKDERLRTCDAENPVVNDLQKLLGGRLFFRWSQSISSLELVLLHAIETAIPFTEWSDGQKEIFYLMLLIDREQPDVLLIDEVENHLHPQYMTAVMDAIKRHVPQTILATHHPHVIFSHYADRVIYIDLHECSFEQLPRVSFMASTGTLREREIRILDDSFEKLSHIYKLFDHQDSQLLR